MPNVKFSQITLGTTLDHVIGLNSGADLQIPVRNILAASSIVSAVRSSSAATVTVSATTDYFLALDPTSNPITVNLPASPGTGITFLIKDATGQAGTNNITVVPASGNIDGASNFVMNTSFQSIAVTYTGAQWSIN